MELGKAIRERRSIRKYSDGEIPQDDMDLIMEAAMMAPSARNSRPWTFVVVRDVIKKEELSVTNPYTKMVSSASCAIVVCGLPSLSEFWQQDCGAAIENMLLQAKDLGYGTCWCGLYPKGESVEHVKNVLHIDDAVPMALVALGIPAESPSLRGHYDKDRIRYVG